MFDDIIHTASKEFRLGRKGKRLMGGIVQAIEGYQGGLWGLLENFRAVGLGPTSAAWVAGRDGADISPADLERGMGSDTVTAVAAHAGMTKNAALGALVQMVPRVIDRMTPNGVYPEPPAGSARRVLTITVVDQGSSVHSDHPQDSSVVGSSPGASGQTTLAQSIRPNTAIAPASPPTSLPPPEVRTAPPAAEAPDPTGTVAPSDAPEPPQVPGTSLNEPVARGLEFAEPAVALTDARQPIHGQATTDTHQPSTRQPLMATPHLNMPSGRIEPGVPYLKGLMPVVLLTIVAAFVAWRSIQLQPHSSHSQERVQSAPHR